MSRRARGWRLPVRPYTKGTVVALFDADDREIIHWGGFDSSCLSLDDQKRLVRDVANGLNATIRKSRSFGEPGALGRVAARLRKEAAKQEHDLDRAAFKMVAAILDEWSMSEDAE